MFPDRPRHAICCPSRGPSFGLFPRHRWYSQRENGTTPYTCERFLVSGFGAPNLHQVATTWPKAAVGGAVKSQRCWIFETATHSRSSATVDSGDSEIATHPAIVDLEPNAAMHLVALIAQREVFGPTSSISVRRLGPRARRERG